MPPHRNVGARPYLAVGWLWYLIMLLPVSGLLQVGIGNAADRFTYLPQIGLALALVWGGFDLCRALTRRQQHYAGAAALAMLAVLGVAGCRRRIFGTTALPSGAMRSSAPRTIGWPTTAWEWP